MKNTTYLAIAFLLSSSWCKADDVGTYLDESTIAVARINLEQFDIQRILKGIDEQAPGAVPQEAQAGINRIGKNLVDGLRQSGASEAYILFSPNVGLYIPTPDPAKAKEAISIALAMLPPDWKTQLISVPEGVLAGPPSVVERLKQRPNADRVGFRTLLQKPSVLSIAVGLRDDMRDSAAMFLSDQIAKDFPVEIPMKQLVSDVKNALIHVDTNDERLSLTVNATDGMANQRNAKWLQQTLSQFIPKASLAKEDKSVVVSTKYKEGMEAVAKLTRSGATAAASSQQANNLKQVVLAMWNFESTHNVLPPRMTVSENGARLLSWRVHLLPFLEEQLLYDQFHLDEPWDSPHNVRLVEKIPFTYRSTEHPDLKLGYTLVGQPLLEGSLWSGEDKKLVKLQDVVDGASRTIAFVIAPKQNAVPWTKPDDFVIEKKRIKESFFGDREEVLFAWLDGSIQTLRRDETSDERVQAALTHNGSETLNLRK